MENSSEENNAKKRSRKIREEVRKKYINGTLEKKTTEILIRKRRKIYT